MRTQEQVGKTGGEIKAGSEGVSEHGGRAGAKTGSKTPANRAGGKKPPEKPTRRERSIAIYVQRARQFLREVKIELKKVKWPTRKELIASTTVVIVLVMIISIYLGLVDFGLIKIIKGIVG